MDTTKPTCRPRYTAAWTEIADKFRDVDQRDFAMFAAGFVVGQTEKVFLGACRAAMFRPAREDRWLILDTLESIREIYNIDWQGVGEDEIWIFRAHDSETCDDICDMNSSHIARDSASWHLLRADLCGVPTREVDVNFHERFGQKDPER